MMSTKRIGATIAQSTQEPIYYRPIQVACSYTIGSKGNMRGKIAGSLRALMYLSSSQLTLAHPTNIISKWLYAINYDTKDERCCTFVHQEPKHITFAQKILLVKHDFFPFFFLYLARKTVSTTSSSSCSFL